MDARIHAIIFKYAVFIKNNIQNFLLKYITRSSSDVSVTVTLTPKLDPHQNKLAPTRNAGEK